MQRAERQYQAVEPENRLVARTLEQRWEAALLELRRVENDYDRFNRDKPQRVTETERRGSRHWLRTSRRCGRRKTRPTRTAKK